MYMYEGGLSSYEDAASSYRHLEWLCFGFFGLKEERVASATGLSGRGGGGLPGCLGCHSRC